MRKLHGERAMWGVLEHELAYVIDVLQGANYQRGGNQGRRPEPYPRPKGPDPRRPSPEEMRARLEDVRRRRLEEKQRRKGVTG